MNDATGEDRHGPGVRLHPPVIFAISILAGIGINNLFPLIMPLVEYSRIIGGSLFALACSLALWSLYEFYRHQTDVRPDRPDSALISSGPYRFTRNPLYIVLSIIQLSVAFWFNNPWIPLLLPASIIIISQYAIAREERYLEKLFGQDYLDYKARVRRWL